MDTTNHTSKVITAPFINALATGSLIRSLCGDLVAPPTIPSSLPSSPVAGYAALLTAGGKPVLQADGSTIYIKTS